LSVCPLRVTLEFMSVAQILICMSSTLQLTSFFFSSRRRHTRSVSAFLLNRSSDLTDRSRTINASLNAATSTRAVSSNPNFVTRQKIEIIFGQIQNGRSLNELNRGQSGLETYGLFSNLTHDFLPISG